MCALDDPTPRLGAGMAHPLAHLLAACPQMQSEGELPGQCARLVIVISLVQAQVLRRLRAGLWPCRSDGFEGLAHQLVIVGVGPGNDDGERDAAAVHQQ